MTTDTSHSIMKERRLERIVVPFAVDSTQQEALLMLKKLKITEDDAKPEQLCTRREYAGWFLRTNSQLERSRKHQINSCAALSGSTVTAFDDVTAQDPDFESIQSLAEAGIIRSKLSGKSSRTSLSDLDGEGCMNFCPDRFVSRQDLISWKVNVEYEVRPGITEEVSMKNIGFLDVREISSDVLVELFLHILFEEKSILKRVFGQSKRFQLRKPCTKAQAAVALASGRSMEFIHAEISRLEAENSSRETEIEEIKSELLERCEIK
ncbi:Glucose-induced degradation protein 8 homolog [Olea europaea subsp. europaea]|uniref:Glucose-induced degradation protein 8 homolog n=1 Tax=Olea europaea subsp. europaea TaxID=158383 RepID=A0A8S0Q154_OLEEU|nr:Glucose-induced degradation protein 8 homolog [Olea europaea subsp. europaea]